MKGRRGLSAGSSLAMLLRDHRGRRHKKYLPALTQTLILTWADAHHAHTGEWPGQDTGPVAAAPGETWSCVNAALGIGGRGLSGGSSLAQLLATHRGVRNHLALPPLTTEQILGWADAHRVHTGAWPRRDSGPIPEAPAESWKAVDKALTDGHRGLMAGGSLARLLQAGRGVRNPAAVPRLQRWEILFWANFHHDRTGHWPTADSGAIPAATGETWARVDDALRAGTRGMPGGDSLARLLHRRCGKRNHVALPALTTELILAWADAHHTRTGRWPTTTSGPVEGVPCQTWSAVGAALNMGNRGLPGGDSLARFLARHCGKRNHLTLPPFAVRQILTWADAHHTRTGAWPSGKSGPIPEAPGELWSAVECALVHGVRGLPGGDSLTRLLTRHRGVPNPAARPALSFEQIRRWVRAHFRRTGQWPRRQDGPIANVSGETWGAVSAALTIGTRGLAGGSSLAHIVRECQPTPAIPGTSTAAGTRAARPR